MLTVAQAQALILQQAHPLPRVTLPLAPALLGRILAEDLVADGDMPPYDKALMDGYAVRSADIHTGLVALDVVEEITAGRTPQWPLGPGQASRIMTGAPIPAGANAVVMVERTRQIDARCVEIADRPPKPGQNILPRGREMRRGETVLTSGVVLRPQEFGVLATVGRSSVAVIPTPTVAVLSTGDEIVEAPQTPGPGQIRNGNGPMLTAQVARSGAVPHYLGIARDSLDSLRPKIEEGLAFDVLILSGGVSAGKLDLVPEVLSQAGVRASVHKVAMKPGKPVFFGTRPRGDGSSTTLIFGLPGNPVSAFVCFELFVRPALHRLMGQRDPGPPLVQALLTEDFTYPTDRPTYHPAHLNLTSEGWRVAPVPWFGSPDLRGLTRANALLVLPVGEGAHRAGQTFEVVRLDGGMLP